MTRVRAKFIGLGLVLVEEMYKVEIDLLRLSFEHDRLLYRGPLRTELQELHVAVLRDHEEEFMALRLRRRRLHRRAKQIARDYGSSKG